MVSPKIDETRQNFSTNRAKVEIISEYVLYKTLIG